MIATREAGTRFLPAYCLRLSALRSCSLDLKLHQKMWSKVKAYLRRAGARRPEALDNAIGTALAKVTSNDA